MVWEHNFLLIYYVVIEWEVNFYLYYTVYNILITAGLVNLLLNLKMSVVNP